MGDLSKEFLAQFHNLPGDTVKEKHQNSFRLFHKYQTAIKKSQEDLDYITENLKPSGHLEKILRIDYLIYFRRFKELYQEFQNGDEITLSKVAKQDWFFQNAFKNLGAEEFVNAVLPTMSYVVKLKILKRLSLDEKQNDEIFDAIQERYGIFLATVFLPKCSVDKISETLKSQPVKFTPSQLKVIYNKDANLICLYLKARTKLDDDKKFMNDNPFFVYLAQKNPEMFSKLFKEYKFSTSLGNRTTKRYIDSQKEIVLAEPKPFIEILKKERLIRKLGYELKDLLFTTRFDNSSYLYWESLLKHYPKKQQFPLYKSTFNAVYHHKFGENLNNITGDVLRLIPDPLEREKLAKLKLQKEEKEDYLKYVTSSYCLSAFMEKLDQMTAAERCNFIQIATECCALNEDVDSLLKLCQLVSTRFKNDETRIRNNFFLALEENKNVVRKFGEKHWKSVMDICALIKAKEEWVCRETSMRFQYLGFLVKNNKSLKEILSKYTNWLDDIEYESRHWKDSKTYKMVLTELIEIGHPKPANDFKTALYDCNLAHACKRYNNKYPKNPINILDNPRILKSIKYTLENHATEDEYIDHQQTDGVQYIICRKDSSGKLDELKMLYFKSLNKFGRLRGVLWFLKHEPKTFQENLDNFLANFAEVHNLNSNKMWYLIKKYNHLDFDKKVVEFCITKLKEEGFDDKKKMVKALSILATADSHLQFMKSYIPTSAKVDLTDDDLKEVYLIQCELLKFLHFIKSPATVLPFALQFCKGDYLKSALGPVYSSVYKLPENQTKVFIDKIDNEKAISVKKHAMSLSCVIYDTDTVYNTLKNATVPSLLPALKYFAKSPSETLWELVDQKLSNVQKKDVQALQWVIPIKFSTEYKSRFVEKTWTILEKYENNKVKKVLMQNIGKSAIEKLHPQFAFKIIEASIFQIEEVDDFISSLFIYLEDQDKFAHFSRILTNFKENCWNHKDMKRISRHKLNSFIKNLFQNYMKLKESKEQFADGFSTMFKSVFSPIETFEEFVVVSFMKLKGETPENCAKFLIQLANNLVKDYDKSVLSVLANVVTDHILPHFFKTDTERIKFCYFLFKYRQSVNDFLLIIKVLPKSASEYVTDFNMYNEILTELEQVSDNYVQLQLNLYLKSKCFNEDSTSIPFFNFCGTCA